MFGYFFWYRKSMVWTASTEDGLVQHLQTLMYYAKWMRGIVRSLLVDHRLSIPAFSFGLGYGDDVLTTLHYYGIGDPLNLVSVFVPLDKIPKLYHILIAVRLYLAGFMFLVFHRYLAWRAPVSPAGRVAFAASQAESGGAEGFAHQTAASETIGSGAFSGFAALAGAMTYVFSAYGIIASTRHPFFINPMIWFPLILLGVEKIRAEQKPLTFTLGVFLAAVSNFYFFYMIALLTVLYVFWRCLPVRGLRGLAKFGKLLVWYLVYAVIGFLMSQFILLPVLGRIINDTRLSRGFRLIRFYSPVYYIRLLARWIGEPSASSWCCLAFGAGGLISIALLVMQWKRGKKLFLLFLILTVFLVLPVCGYVLNGFSYPSDRWVWAYGLLVSSVICLKWKALMELGQGGLTALGITALVCGIACRVLENSLSSAVSIQLFLAVLILLVLAVGRRQGSGEISRGIQTEAAQTVAASRRYARRREAAVFLLICLSLANNGYQWYSWRGESGITSYVDLGNVRQEALDTDARAVANVGGRDSFYRYAGDGIRRNAALMAGMSSTQYFWSMSNPLVNQYMTDLAVSDPKNYATLFQGLDTRTVLNELAGVKYFVTNRAVRLPYGYRKEPADEALSGDYVIYENDNALPFGYTYSSTVSETDWAGLNPAAKEQTMLRSAVVSGRAEGLSQGTVTDKTRQLQFTVKPDSKDVVCVDHGFIVTGADASVTLKVNNSAAYSLSETSLYFTGLSFEPYTKYDLYHDETVAAADKRFTEKKFGKLDAVRQARIRSEALSEKANNDVLISCLFRTDQQKKLTKRMNLCTDENAFGKGQRDFLVNGGTSENGKIVEIRLTLPETGIYTWDSMQVISADLSGYEEQTAALQENTLQYVDFHENTSWNATSQITGSIRLEENKLLCLSMPYSDGWTAYVDGAKQRLLRVNGMFAGLVLEAGDHELSLVYETPYRNLGVMCSAVGLALLIALEVVRNRRKHGKKQQKTAES